MSYFSAMATILTAVLTLSAFSVSQVKGDCTGTSDLGRTECVLLFPVYTKFQLATCLTKDYIEHLGDAIGRKYRCRDPLAMQCYYQCMLAVHGRRVGFVYDDCSCSPADTSIPQNPLDPECYNPSGNCSWYAQCLEKKFPCSGKEHDYAIAFGEKFCNLYNKKYSEFGEEAQSWIDATRKCLQSKLVHFLTFEKKASCEDIYKEAFESHITCYLSPQASQPGICQLPCIDLWKIVLLVIGNVKSNSTSESVGHLIAIGMQMVEVAFGCLRDLLKITCLEEIKEKIKQVVIDFVLFVKSSFLSLLKYSKKIFEGIANYLSERFWKKHDLQWFLSFKNHSQSARAARLKQNDSDSQLLNFQVLLVDKRSLYTRQARPSVSSSSLEKAVSEVTNAVRSGGLSNVQVTVAGMLVFARVSRFGRGQKYIVTLYLVDNLNAIQ